MAYSHEELTLWSIASLTKYFKGYEFGVPVLINHQALEQDVPKSNSLEINFDGPNFSNAGTKNEKYGIIQVSILIKTDFVPTDIYHHARLQAKVAEAMMKPIPLKKVGAVSYDGAIVGYLRPLKTDYFEINTVSVEEPDGSLANKVYCIDLC